VDQSLLPITVETIATPEPSTVLLIGVGLWFVLVLANKGHSKRAT
jgi:hypothetical protein